MGRASEKLAFHSVWGNGGFVCLALTAETISQFLPKDWQVFSPPPPALWCSGSLFHIARQTRGSLLTAKHSTVPPLHLGSVAPQNLQPSAPSALLTDTALSSSALHPSLAAHSLLLSSPFAPPQSLSHAGLHHSFPDGCWEKGWEAAGSSTPPQIPLQAAGAGAAWKECAVPGEGWICFLSPFHLRIVGPIPAVPKSTQQTTIPLFWSESQSSETFPKETYKISMVHEMNCLLLIIQLSYG